MNAAIYVRKSSMQAGISEECRSVERQKAHALEYAARKGWTVYLNIFLRMTESAVQSSNVGQGFSD